MLGPGNDGRSGRGPTLGGGQVCLLQILAAMRQRRKANFSFSLGGPRLHVRWRGAKRLLHPATSEQLMAMGLDSTHGVQVGNGIAHVKPSTWATALVTLVPFKATIKRASAPTFSKKKKVSIFFKFLDVIEVPDCGFQSRPIFHGNLLPFILDVADLCHQQREKRCCETIALLRRLAVLAGLTASCMIFPSGAAFLLHCHAPIM